MVFYRKHVYVCTNLFGEYFAGSYRSVVNKAHSVKPEPNYDGLFARRGVLCHLWWPLVNYHMSTAVHNVNCKSHTAVSKENKYQTSTHRERETRGAIVDILTLSDYVISPINHPKFYYLTIRCLG